MRLYTLLFLFAVLCAPSLVNAQSDDKEEDRWNGLRAGWYRSSLFDPDAETNPDPRNGFYAGYYRNLIKVPLYRLSSGLEYHTSGAVSGPSEVRLGYLYLCLNNRLKLGPVYVDLGLDPAFKLTEKFLLDGTEIDVDSEFEGETFDLLLHGGAGFKFLFIGVEARYRYGLLEVYDNTRNTGLELGVTAFF